MEDIANELSTDKMSHYTDTAVELAMAYWPWPTDPD